MKLIPPLFFVHAEWLCLVYSAAKKEFDMTDEVETIELNDYRTYSYYSADEFIGKSVTGFSRKGNIRPVSCFGV